MTKHINALSAQYGGKIPFGSMKGDILTTPPPRKKPKKKSRKPRRKSLTRQRRKSKGRITATKAKEPIMSPKHLANKVIQRGRDGNLYEVNHGKWKKL